MRMTTECATVLLALRDEAHKGRAYDVMVNNVCL